VKKNNITLFYDYSKRVWGKALLTGMKGMKTITQRQNWTLINAEKNDEKQTYSF